MGKQYLRQILKFLANGPNGGTLMEKILYSYRNPSAKLIHKIKYAPLHKAIDYFARKAEVQQGVISDKIFHHQPSVRVLVNTARSVAAYGLTEPQRFVAPLMTVWNTTNLCNLACKHCYQEAGLRIKDELSRLEKIAVVDQLSDNYVPILIIAGGEPFLDPDLWAVLERSRAKRIYCTIATNGTLLTPENCRRLVALGVNYIEVSLDSIDPAIHDEFRQTKGAWERSVQGIRNAVQTPGLECGIATCFIKDTVGRAEDMIHFAISLGAKRFVHFNFLPIGRASLMADQELDRTQQGQLMRLFHKTLKEGKVDVWSTAPQFGRMFLTLGDLERVGAVGTGGSDNGLLAKVLSRFIGGCAARRCYCSIQPNGRITPCLSMPGEILGDLRVSTFLEIWNQATQGPTGDRHYRKSHSFCAGCRAKSFSEDADAGDLGCIFNMPLFSKMQEWLTPIPGKLN